MALGGGNWLTQNKVLPGSYINFSSVAKASATLSDRGYAAAPFVLSWGPEGEVFPVTSGEFQKNSKAIFGYGYDHPKLLALREFSSTPPRLLLAAGQRRKGKLHLCGCQIPRCAWQ